MARKSNNDNDRSTDQSNSSKYAPISETQLPHGKKNRHTKNVNFRNEIKSIYSEIDGRVRRRSTCADHTCEGEHCVEQTWWIDSSAYAIWIARKSSDYCCKYIYNATHNNNKQKHPKLCWNVHSGRTNKCSVCCYN